MKLRKVSPPQSGRVGWGYSPKYTNQSNKNSFFNKNLILSNLYPTFAPENI